MKALDIEENGRTTVSRMLNTLIKKEAANSAGKRGPTPMYSLAPTTAPDLPTSNPQRGSPMTGTAAVTVAPGAPVLLEVGDDDAHSVPSPATGSSDPRACIRFMRPLVGEM
jgi:hypothetical protein